MNFSHVCVYVCVYIHSGETGTVAYFCAFLCMRLRLFACRICIPRNMLCASAYAYTPYVHTFTHACIHACMYVYYCASVRPCKVRDRIHTSRHGALRLTDWLIPAPPGTLRDRLRYSLVRNQVIRGT